MDSSVSSFELGVEGQQIVRAGFDFAFDLGTVLSESSLGFSSAAHRTIWAETHDLIRAYAAEGYLG